MTTLSPIFTEVKPAFDLTFNLDPDGDDYRPTAGPDFTPTADEDAEAVELLNAEDPDPSDPEWDRRAEAAREMDLVCSGHAWL